MPGVGSPIYRLRATDTQRAHWQSAADACGLSLAAWLKATADQAVVSGHNPADLRREISDVRRKLAGATNNLNQVAHAANAGGYVDRRKLDKTIDEIDRLRAQLSEVLR